ncbi:MAG: hypothetical protein U1A27_00540 [Phycisphaerae bacterium]
MKLPFVVLAVGRFPRDAVRVTFEDVPRSTTPELEAIIAREWEARLAIAQQRDQSLYDGRLVRYRSHLQREDGLAICTGPTGYREFVGTNLYHADRLDEFGWERFANPIGTTATLETADGFLVFGRRSQRVAFHGGHVHTIGGTLETVDVRPDGTVDVFASVLRELHEEAGLSAAALESFDCVGLIRDREIVQPELLFEGRTRLRLAELMAAMRGAEAADEHVALVALPAAPAAVVPFLCQRRPIAPVACGALLLSGAARWGQKWFESAAKAWSAAS